MKVLTSFLAALVAATGIAIAAPDQKSKQKAPTQAKKVEREAKPTPRSPQSQRPPSVATPRTEKVAWLGVATSPVAPVLRQHLELAEGFGIQVEYVVENSPAEKAGLSTRDIVTQLDDQLLTSPEHLAVLVRSKMKGDKITLTLIRKGTEKTIEVTLGENELPAQPEWPRSFGIQAQPSPSNPGHMEFRGQVPVPNLDSEHWEKGLREYQDRVREWMERNQPHRFVPSPPHPQGSKADPKSEKAQPVLPLPEKGDSKKPVSRPASGNTKPPAISVRPGFPIQVFSGAGMIRIDNNEGEVTIQVKDGEHTIKIVNADGETVYEGDYAPEKGAEGLPEEAGKQLKKMKLDDLKLLGVPENGTKTETKTEIKIQIDSQGKPANSPKPPVRSQDDLL